MRNACCGNCQVILRGDFLQHMRMKLFSHTPFRLARMSVFLLRRAWVGIIICDRQDLLPNNIVYNSRQGKSCPGYILRQLLFQHCLRTKNVCNDTYNSETLEKNQDHPYPSRYMFKRKQHYKKIHHQYSQLNQPPTPHNVEQEQNSTSNATDTRNRGHNSTGTQRLKN